MYIPDCENNGRMKRSIEVEDEAVEVNATTTNLSPTVVPLANNTNGNTTVLPAVTELPTTETEATTIQVPSSSSKLADYSTEIDILEEYTVTMPSSTTKSDDNFPFWDHSFDSAQVEEVDQPDYILCEPYPTGEVIPPHTTESSLTRQQEMEVDPIEGNPFARHVSYSQSCVLSRFTDVFTSNLLFIHRFFLAVSRAIQTQRASMMTTVPEKDSQLTTESSVNSELDVNSTTTTDSGLEIGTAESVDYNLIEDDKDTDYWLSANGDAHVRSPDVSTTEITTKTTISSTVIKQEVDSTTYPAGIVKFPSNGNHIEGPVGGEIKP